MRSILHNRKVLVILLAAVCVIAFSADADAQAPKKTAKATPKATPKPLATPPVLTGAEIISRSAEDYVIQPQPAATPIDKPVDGAAVSDVSWLKDLQDRINKLETVKKDTYEDRQKRLLLNLDILTRAEQRSESLRKQVFEMTDKENAIKSRMDQIDYESRPEIIERILQLGGSLRPEEVRESRRKTLMAEKANLQALLVEVQRNKTTVSVNLEKAEQMVEKLRTKLEKDIDDSFLKIDPDN